MLDPRRRYVIPSQLYRRICPEPEPFPSLPEAPMANTLPSLESETEVPELSPAAQPSMPDPC